jgi:hypothetical protein
MKYVVDLLVKLIVLIGLSLATIALVLWHFELNPITRKATTHHNGRRLSDEWLDNHQHKVRVH